MAAESATIPLFAVTRMTEAGADAAWPLIRIGAGGVSFADWRDQVRSLVGRGGGILGASGPDGRLHGIAVFRCEETLAGRFLRIDPIVTFELSARAPVRAALVRALEQQALRKGCRGLSVAPSRRADPGGWEALGFRRDGLFFAKPLAESPRRFA